VIAAGNGKADTSMVSIASAPAPGQYLTVAKQDWNNYASKASLAGMFGVEGSMHDCGNTADKTLCAPILPATDFYDLVPDPLFGKVVRYNGGPHLNTYLTTRPGRVAVHGTGVTQLTNVWVRQFVRFSPNYTTVSNTGGQGAASHKLLFLRFPGSDRAAVILEGPRTWTIEHASSTTSTWLPENTILGTNTKCNTSGWPGGGDIGSYDAMFKMDAKANTCAAVPQGNGEWYEIILHHEQLDATTAVWMTRWRRYTPTPGPWRIWGQRDVRAAGWDPIYRYEMGVNRNRQWDENMFIDWGPYEVVDGSKYPNPWGL
jgi:hypothetical protein